jgi:xanthine dehydrogenase accessory factor
MDIYQEIVKIIAEGESAALATIVLATDGSPRKEGTKMLMKKDGSAMGTVGGGSVEDQVRREALEVIKEGKPRLLHFGLTGEEGEQRGMICGGTMDVFIEPILSLPTLYLFGAGHISLAVAKIGKMLGFRVVVIDQNPEFADPVRFPEADMILVEQWEQVFPKLQIDDSSYIIILTGSHITDQRVLEWALGTETKYIGMISSKDKREAIFSNLSAKGIAEELLNKVYSPIGLEIHAETPDEIAVSILAQIVKIRRAP